MVVFLQQRPWSPLEVFTRPLQHKTWRVRFGVRCANRTCCLVGGFLKCFHLYNQPDMDLEIPDPQDDISMLGKSCRSNVHLRRVRELQRDRCKCRKKPTSLQPFHLNDLGIVFTWVQLICRSVLKGNKNCRKFSGHAMSSGK